MEQQTRKEIDVLLACLTRTDARVMAMQMTLSEILKQNKEQQEAFAANLEDNCNRVFRLMVEDMRKKDPVSTARVFGEKNG